MSGISRNRSWIILLAVLLFLSLSLYAQTPTEQAVFLSKEGKLIYSTDSKGNRIPDFSYCGYHTGEQAIPDVPIKVRVPLKEGDATSRIQRAIDYVASLPLNESGFRGAILLEKGEYRLLGRLRINASGIVLRGSGTGDAGTVMVADGVDRKTLLRIAGEDDLQSEGEIKIIDEYVPLNAMSFSLENTKSINEGDRIRIHRPSSEEWIAELEMGDFGGETGWIGWKPGTRDIFWERKVVIINKNQITVDSPITTSLDKKFGGGFVSKYSWPGRISHVGIENLSLKSAYDTSNLKDENHCWMAITLESVSDAWVRQVNFEHFAGSAVAIFESAKRVTVEDCISLNTISEIGGQRRYTFLVSGQQTLVQRCYAANGYHDFTAGFCAPGPNAFVQCESSLPFSFSGAIDSWASGVLFDNVCVDGNALSFKNRMQDAQGAGWSAANSVFWQCSASKIECYRPPTAQNWAIGTWASFSGNGIWLESNDHIKPRSLYYKQLSERVGEQVMSRAHLLPISHKASTSPTIEEAKEFTYESKDDAIQLKEWIANSFSRQSIPVDADKALTIDEINLPELKTIPENSAMRIENGLMVNEKGILTGQVHGVRWWRGNARPFATAKSSPHITRFVPGRTGIGYTDNLEEVTDWMEKNKVLAIEHNYGLWYDRRRDDHERVRRMDGEVWPPFYELPFSRSGEGIAWDGLSKYDLTKYNPWYWNRLKEFANLADQKGLVLLHNNYFQHNILEAGAHWSDFPWRSANNINHTDFPEPPPYVGDKRIFMDEQFYDITNPARHDLHRSYIRKCLSNFSENQNVVQLISAEYTGPLHFVKFWMDVIMEWEEETGKNVLVGLSTTKDVQDTILMDVARSGAVDIIDIRYWQYRSDGSLYNPPGGQHLAPRQHARLVKPGEVSFESVYRAVKEYRTKYPEKAIIYSGRLSNNLNWAVFMAGGSMAGIPALENPEILKIASRMKPVETVETSSRKWMLSDKQNYIIFSLDGESIPLDFISDPGKYKFIWIDPKDGRTIKVELKNIESAKSEIKLPIHGDLLVSIIKE